jgi:hypothetical protein
VVGAVAVALVEVLDVPADGLNGTGVEHAARRATTSTQGALHGR